MILAGTGEGWAKMMVVGKVSEKLESGCPGVYSG